MKLTIVSENPTTRVPTVTFSVYRDDVFEHMQQDQNPFAKLSCADWVIRYNFILRNFAVTKDRYNLGAHSFSRRFLNGIHLTHDLRIKEERDLMWFTLQYENVAVDRVIDFPGLIVDSLDFA